MEITHVFTQCTRYSEIFKGDRKVSFDKLSFDYLIFIFQAPGNIQAEPVNLDLVPGKIGLGRFYSNLKSQTC